MTVWNDADFTQRLAHANWMANTAVLMYLNERATGDPARDWLSSWAHQWFVGDNLRVLVLGCGEGWLERAVAQWPFVAHIDAVDFAEHAIARARELARDIPKIHYGVVDLNTDVLTPNHYDVIVAHSVLHHIENLKHAYAQLELAMKPDATLIINEYVGPDRFQYSDDVDAIINTLLRCLPWELRKPYESRVRPTVAEMIANDPTEAVRASELVAFTERVFDVRERRPIGGTILQHLLYDIVQNFRFDNAWERSVLDMLCVIEGMLVDRGRVPCDFVLMAARKWGASVSKMPRPLPPRAEGADDVEDDPLRNAAVPAAGSAASPPPSHNGSETLPVQPARTPALRLRRLALLSQKPHRANLFAETHTTPAPLPDDPVIRGLFETAMRLTR